ncbi:MAG: DUF58 domain-containing protein [Verrucomicrobiales bacterium]|nr:DUF58 domain-containing protein [Verrucomicrobiales bacterium]
MKDSGSTRASPGSKWLLGALALLALGAAFRLGLLVYAMYALLGVMLLGWFAVQRWIGSLEVRRDCDRTDAAIGDSAEVVVTLRNASRSSIPWTLLEDCLPADALSASPARIVARGPRLSLVRLRAGEEETLRYQVEFLARGCYPIGPILAESGDFFGLHRGFRVVGEPVFVQVPPKVVPLEGYDIASSRPMGEIRLVHRLFEDPTRQSGIRDYQDGDPYNRIHWRATARLGRLQSRTFEPSVVAGATLLLDFHRDSLAGEGEFARTELAASAAASLASALHQLGSPVGFFSNGRDTVDRIREEGWNRDFRTREQARSRTTLVAGSDRLRPVGVETRRAADQLGRILQCLARLEPTDGLSFPSLLAEVSSRLPRNASVIAILQDVSEETAVALSGLGRQGYRVTAVQVRFDSREAPAWAAGPDWAAWLVGSGIQVRRIHDDASLSHLCSETLVR